MPPLSARAQHTGSSARVVHTPNKCSVGYGVRPEESFLDWLMETINYDKPGYNDVLEVEIIGDSVSHSVLVVIH